MQSCNGLVIFGSSRVVQDNIFLDVDRGFLRCTIPPNGSTVVLSVF
jgi:hypothetical protein